MKSVISRMLCDKKSISPHWKEFLCLPCEGCFAARDGSFAAAVHHQPSTVYGDLFLDHSVHHQPSTVYGDLVWDHSVHHKTSLVYVDFLSGAPLLSEEHSVALEEPDGEKVHETQHEHA